MKQILLSIAGIVLLNFSPTYGNPFSTQIGQTNNTASLRLDQVSYKGYVLYGAKKFAIVKFGAEEHILGANEKLQSHRLVAVTPNYIELEKENQLFRVTVNTERNL